MRGKMRLMLLLGGIVAVAVAATWYFLSSKPLSQLPEKLVSTTTVSLKNIPLSYQTDGDIVAPNSLMLKAQKAGVIKIINVTEGAYVKQGDVLFTLDDTNEMAELLKAQAQFNFDKLQFGRYKTLWQQGGISKADYDTAQSKFEQDQGALNEAKYNEALTKVVAPFSGNVGATNLAPGSVLAVGDDLVNLVDRNDLEIQYDVPQNLLGQAQLGQSVTFTLDAYPGETFHARVSYISPLVNQNAGSFTERAKIEQSASTLLPGMIVHVNQIFNPNYKALVVPAISLIGDVSGYVVYTVQNGKVASVPVTVGARGNEWVEVTSGLPQGAQVIVAGQEKVKPGDRVQVSS